MSVWRCPKCGSTYNDREPQRAATALHVSHVCPRNQNRVTDYKQEDNK